MNFQYLVEIMNDSIQKVEESVLHMEYHTSISKAEQLQVMQAVLELSERIKNIETFVELKNLRH